MLNRDLANRPRALTWRPWLLRPFISALALVSFALVVYGGSNRLPFSTQCAGSSCLITSVLANAAPTPLRAGDRILFADQPFAARAVLLNENVPRARGYELRVRRGTRLFTVTVHTLHSSHAEAFVTRTMISFIFLFGLLMLWRGDSAASRGLCLFALSAVVTGGLSTRPFAPPWNLLSLALTTLLGGPAIFMGLYITADALVPADPDPRAARRARAAYVGLLLLLYLTEVAPNALLASGRDVPFFNIAQVATIALAIVVWIIPLVNLLKGYRASAPQSRLRIRWFIASIALVLPLIACNLLLESARTYSAAGADFLRLAQVLLIVAIFSILSYAALTQRLVAVRFVLNRALVFAILTASLIGVLSLLESLIERSVISKEAGMALDLAVPLLLGVFIQRIHRWGEESVERVVFRKEYRDRNEITTFLRDAGFISQPATLFARAADVFATHAGGRYAALYLAEKSGYERVAASDRAGVLPDRIPIDDVAMVRLRATLAPLDLFKLSSALGPSGLALPLVVRGRLEGVLLCGPKAEGRYAQAEIEFLDKAASGIAACVIALRAELRGHFVSRVAVGGLPAERIVEEARRLVEM